MSDVADVGKGAFVRRKLWLRGSFSRFRPTMFRLQNLLFSFSVATGLIS